MKQKLIIYLLPFLLLASCKDEGNKTNNSKSYEEATKNLTFIDELKDEELTKPKRVISSRDDFKYAFDYLAFYEINKKISFDISSDYASSFYNIYQEYRSSYNVTDLAYNYPIDFNYDLYDKYKVITFKVILRDLGVNKPTKLENATFIHQVDYKNDYKERGEDFDSYPLKKKNKGYVHVDRSEELWYVINKGYYPICEEGSIAETIFKEAKSILNRIILDEFDELTKAKQIYNFLTSEVHYDSYTANLESSSLEKEQCYFLEGVFLNRLAVCDGKAKAYCLLAGMEGIEIYKANDYKDSYIGHAYNYIKVSGNYYLSCTTFGSNKITLSNKRDYVIPTYNMFLVNYETPYKDKWGYDSSMYKEISTKIEKKSYDYPREFKINDKNLLIYKEEDLFNLIDGLNKTEGALKLKTFEFRLMDEKLDILVLKDLIEKRYSSYGIDFLKNKPDDDRLFQIIFY